MLERERQALVTRREGPQQRAGAKQLILSCFPPASQTRPSPAAGVPLPALRLLHNPPLWNSQDDDTHCLFSCEKTKPARCLCSGETRAIPQNQTHLQGSSPQARPSASHALPPECGKIPRFNLQQEGRLTTMQGPCWSNTLVVWLTQLLLSLRSGVRLRKNRQNTKRKPALWLQRMRGKGWRETFARGMVFKVAKKVSQGQDSTGETDLAAVKTALWVLFNLDTCSPSYLLMCSSAQSPQNWALHNGGEGIPFKRVSIALPVFT